MKWLFCFKILALLHCNWEQKIWHAIGSHNGAYKNEGFMLLLQAYNVTCVQFSHCSCLATSWLQPIKMPLASREERIIITTRVKQYKSLTLMQRVECYDLHKPQEHPVLFDLLLQLISLMEYILTDSHCKGEKVRRIGMREGNKVTIIAV